MTKYQVILTDRLGNKEIYGEYNTIEEAAEKCNGWDSNEIKDARVKRITK